MQITFGNERIYPNFPFGRPYGEEEEAPAPATPAAPDNEQYVRLAAEYDNYRKRTRRDIEQARQDAKAQTLKEFLPVLDNLGRAFQNLTAQSRPEVLYDGLRMIQAQLSEGLARLGVQKMDVVGQPFDPTLHEAVLQTPAELPEDTVAQEFLAGYTLDENLLRPARVGVSSGPAA